MAVNTGARLGILWNYAAGDNGWGTNMNRVLRLIDALLGGYMLSNTLSTPPASPANGDLYWVAGTGTGAWAGQNGQLACYQTGTWYFYPPPIGMRARIAALSGTYYWTGTAWALDGAGVTADPAPVSFVFPGKPAAGAVFNLPLAAPLTIPANLAGSLCYSGTLATAAATFLLKYIRSGTTNSIGSIIIGTASRTTITLPTTVQLNFLAGDVIQLTAPGTQDATLADLGLTLFGTKA